MGIGSILQRWFIGDLCDPEAFTLDHVPLSGNTDYSEKVKAAGEKYPNPFLCGPDTVTREVIVNGKAETVRPGERPKATVTPIRRGK